MNVNDILVIINYNIIINFDYKLLFESIRDEDI